MEKSSITKLRRRTAAGSSTPGTTRGRAGHPLRGSNSDFSRQLGSLIRARRRELGLTQTQLGHPLTKGFISEVERGRSLPSLGALVLMAERLGVPASYLLGEAVNGALPAVYTARDENEHAPSGTGR